MTQRKTDKSQQKKDAEIGNLIADAMTVSWNRAIDSAAQVVLRYLSAYPIEVFPQAPAGKHGKTVDSCSASALRSVLPSIAEDIQKLKRVNRFSAKDKKARKTKVR